MMMASEQTKEKRRNKGHETLRHLCVGLVKLVRRRSGKPARPEHGRNYWGLMAAIHA